MKKYIKLFKNRLAVGLEYRSNIVSTLILDLISLASVLILWFAIFREHNQIQSYSFHDAILYYLLVPFVGSFTYVMVSNDLGYEIREGALSNYLLKPFNLHIDAFCRAIASKINYIFVTLPVYALIVFVFMYVYGSKGVTMLSVLIGMFMIAIGFLMHFVLDLMMTWLAFWIGDVWTFKHLKNIVFLIFGGMIFPLEFVTGPLRILFEFLPFKYMYYLPVAYLLSKRGAEYLFSDLIGAMLWMCIFIILSQMLWNRGLRKFEAYGG